MADREDGDAAQESSDEDFESADDGDSDDDEPTVSTGKSENVAENTDKKPEEERTVEETEPSPKEEQKSSPAKEVPRLSTLISAKIDSARTEQTQLKDSEKDDQKLCQDQEPEKKECPDDEPCENIEESVSTRDSQAQDQESNRDLEEGEETNTESKRTENVESKEPSEPKSADTQPPKQDFNSLFSGWGWSETPSAPATTPTEPSQESTGSSSVVGGGDAGSGGSGGGGWGWGSWGNVLSQATASLSNVIESVEATLGVPDPEKLAHHVKTEEDEVKQAKTLEPNAESHEQEQEQNGKDEETQNTGLLSALGVSVLTNVVQSKGKELMSGGLDALEFLGKRTMDVLSEGDPALRKKREAITGKGPSLSQIIREAKQVTEQKAAEKAFSEESSNLVCFSSEFDEFQGLAHLEALEMLSHQSEAKVESLLMGMSGKPLDVAKFRLRGMQEAGELSEDLEDTEDKSSEDFASEITEAIMTLNLGCVPDKLTRVDAGAWEWLDACIKEQDEQTGSKDPHEMYSKSISTLAELTARGVEQFHKIAELILLKDPSENDTDSLTLTKCVKSLTEVQCSEISRLSTLCAGCLNTAAVDSENPELINPWITSVYLEAANSSSYIQDAYKLMAPILQLAVLKKIDVSET